MQEAWQSESRALNDVVRAPSSATIVSNAFGLRTVEQKASFVASGGRMFR